MVKKLKYINLFEELSRDEIPYSEIDGGYLNIKFPKSATSVPLELNQVTTDVNGWIEIEDTQLTEVTGFNQLQSVGWDLSIWHNTVLQSVTGFDQLQKIGGRLSIRGNTVLETVPGFNQLQSVGSSLSINSNTALKTITGFDQLQRIGGRLSIRGNTVLETVPGFNQLQSVGDYLWITNNPNLVTLSIPSTMIRSVNYQNYSIYFEGNHEFKSPEEFVNSELVIQDCIDKFDPGLHGNIVVTQIMENIETWGTPATQGVIINHLLSKGNYWSLIPENLQHLAEDTYKHLYHPDFNNTGAKSVAKVATGVTYGLF